MTDKLLYYPYINVPNNAWTIRSILYWDSVSAIVPPIYRDNPNRFEYNMHQMVLEGLIEQVYPFNYIQEIPNFSEAFLELINKQRHNIDKKRQVFQQGNKYLIHTQKFGSNILDNLVDLGIAERDRNSWEWYYVETATANLFMKYLATVIAIEGEFTPATDQFNQAQPTFYKKSFSIENYSTYQSILKNQIIRGELLETLMPYPDPDNLDFNRLRRFKDDNYEQLKRFRNRLEQIIIDISNIKNKENRENYYKCESVVKKLDK